jgi:hypothetical protein
VSEFNRSQNQHMSRTWSTWNPFKPFGREKAEVVRFIEGVLDGTLDCREWDNFLRIPMKGTPDLEAIRVACVALEPEETMDAEGTIVHSEPARQKIQSLLEVLK